MTLEEWAKKAREELRKHCVFTVYNNDDSEDINNDEVIALCNEYDELMKEKPKVVVKKESDNDILWDPWGNMIFK